MKKIIFIIISLNLFLIINLQAKESKFLQDTTRPVINHNPNYYCSYYSWPKYLTAVVTDSSGIDSVWVKWYKNNPGTMNRRFKMTRYPGNYGGTFNSILSEVNLWDIIYYRIFAQDSSANHNIDSTPLIPMTITDGGTCWFGNGTDSSKYPFTTYWMDGRTQMLFTAQEINTCVNFGGITSIGFHVFSSSNQVMNGFSVKFQHTTQTSLTGFVTTGWTYAYSGTYTVQDTGWQTINMQYPLFWYNGTSNLLMEICFDNSSYTQYSYVYSTPVPSMTWGYYTDNQTGCTMTGGTSQSRRPNVKFHFQTYYGINTNRNSNPINYSLSQNYPNPFNPVTRIDFEIPKKGFVSLKVFDILGREVRTLVFEEKPAGAYSIDFNASDLSSGVYLYRINAGDFSEIKRMILVK